MLGLSRLEKATLVAAAVLSPLWFFTIAGVNLNPADFVFLAVFALFVGRRSIYPFSPSRTTAISIFVFLAIAGLSIIWTPRPVSALLDYAQYIFIFLVVVPLTSYALQDRATRWSVFVAVWAVTNVLALLAAATFIFGDVNQVRHVTLWYGNQNQLFWLVASAWVCNVAIVLEQSEHNLIRLGAGFLAVLETGLIFGGMTLSAILVLAAGAWAFAAWIARRRSTRATVTLAIATVVAALAGFGLIVQHWETFYIEASLHVRIPQYVAALERGFAHFPLGAGIDSSAVVMDVYPESYRRSIHNFLLAYFLELGIIGAAAFLAIVIIWVRDVFITSLQYPFRLNAFEYAFLVIFGTYLLVILFQPVPVHRYWWLMFGASWAVTQDTLIRE